MSFAPDISAVESADIGVTARRLLPYPKPQSDCAGAIRIATFPGTSLDVSQHHDRVTTTEQPSGLSDNSIKLPRM